MKHITLLILSCLAMLLPISVMAEGERIDYEGELIVGGSTRSFAPLYMSALTHGVISQADNTLLKLSLKHDLDTVPRLSWGYGVKAYGGYNNAIDYERFDAASGLWSEHALHQSRLWLQELYGQLKFRGVFLEIGMKEQRSPLVDHDVSSGDLIVSGNTRPMPGVRAGFINFQNIPLTNGWVQIEGQLFYGKFMDSSWWDDHSNLFNGHVTDGQYYVYRRCYFRTKPSQPFSVTVGTQCASLFGGDGRSYREGVLYKTEHYPCRFKDFIKMFWPIEDGTEGFTQGNTLGSWDLRARYRLRDRSEVSFYFQWPWEDGSGIGKMNGLDGLWGVEYKFAEQSSFIDAVAVEYLDLTNQSGPIHWAPNDNPGTSITSQTTGADDYYNNAFYNPYAYYGLSIGTPMAMAPIYNRDGYMAFIANRMRAIHLGAIGHIGTDWDWRLKLGHRRGWGNGMIQLPRQIKCTSVMAEAAYRFPSIPGLRTRLMIAYDHGSMPQSSFGALVGIQYNGIFTIKRK